MTIYPFHTEQLMAEQPMTHVCYRVGFFRLVGEAESRFKIQTNICTQQTMKNHTQFHKKLNILSDALNKY